METVVTDLAKPYIEKLINGAISESRLLFCLPRIEKEYEEERDRLEVERTTVRQHANVATGRGDEIQANVRRWVEDVDELIGEDQNVETKHKYFCAICPNCIWRYKKGKELANKTEQIKILIEKREKLENVGVSSQLPGIERYSSQNYISFESRESKYKELLDALKDDSNYIIGMQGMGGTGKTTLAKEVGKQLKQSEVFSKVIVTIVSCTPDIKKIQNDIAGPLGLKLEESDNESDRSGKLWKRLTNGEKILLILDDVWDGDSPLDFEAIGIPKQDKHEGCKLLVTTRTKQVLIKMDYKKMIELDLLSEEEAWIMFKRYAGISNKGTSKSLIEKGGKIAEECKRLPVAISVIASSLKGQHDRPHVWNATLKSLKNHVSIQGDDEERVGIYKYLKPSYDNMRDERARGLFLLCSLFREDEEIDVELLIRLGIGAGLYGEEYGRYNDARDKVVMTIDKLLDSCLLLKSGKGCVKMHDLVRTAARWMKKEEIRAVHMSHEDPNLLVEKKNNTTTKYMLCEGKAMDVFYSRFGGSNLEILITRFDKGRYADYVPVNVPNSTFENIARLRALVIQNECNYRALLPLSLPDSIQSLTNIRSLILDKVDLGDISVLGNLQSLETLDLCDCSINELPPEIAKMKKLKVLGLSRCGITRNNPFQVIRECSSLEQLDFNENFNCFCQEIVFPKLQGYYIHMNLESDIMNQYESTLRCIIFGGDGDVGFFSEATFKYCMETTEILCLEGIKWEWRNLIPEIVPIDKGMNDLIHLRLRDISQLQYLIDFENSNLSNVMSKLVVLELYEMQNLEELCTGDLSVKSLKSLEKLKIKECNYLQSLFKYKVNLCNLKIMKLVKCPMLVSLSTYRSLVLLEEMVIKDCEQLKSIIINDDERREEDELGEVVVVDRDNKNKSHGSMFQKLKLLFIRGCPLLECVLPFLVDHDLPVLESIKIERCQGLKYIFGKEVKLGSLQTLILIELPNFIDMFPDCFLPMSSSKKASTSTSRHCSMPQTQSHPIICNSFSWSHICCYVKKTKRKLKTVTSAKSQDQLHDYSVALESNSYRLHKWERAECLLMHPHILCNIKQIILSHISKIKSMSILSIASRLVMLETLVIVECHELKHIIIETREDNKGNSWANVFPKLEMLHVENCGQLEYIFGHSTVDYQNDSQIHIHLPVLKSLKLCKLPNLVAVCPKNYITTFPSLVELVLNECSEFAINPIGDLVAHPIPGSIDNTTIKELSGNVDHLERPEINEKYEHEVTLVLQDIQLYDLPLMKYIFVGPINSLTLQNLSRIFIVRCENLEIIFSTSIVKCLEILAIEKCNKLKYVFPVSISKRLHGIKVLLIKEADKLEEIFKCEGDQKVEIPNLRILILHDLPSLCTIEGIQLQDVEYHLLRNCQILSITSKVSDSTPSVYFYIPDPFIDYELYSYLSTIFEQLQEDSQEQDTSSENPSVGNNIDTIVADEDEEVSENKLISSQIQNEQIVEEEHELVACLEILSMANLPTTSKASLNEQSMDEQCPLGETDTIVTSSRGNHNNGVKEIEDQSIQEDAASQKPITSKQKASLNDQSMDNQCPLRETITTVTTSQGNHNNGLTEIEDATSEKIVTLKQKDDGNGQNVKPSFSTAKEDVDIRGIQKSIETHDQVSLNDRVAVKMSLVIENQLSISKDHEIRVYESSPSVVAYQSPSIPSEGNPSQIVEDLSSSSLIIREELEQLVFNKQLASENVSLLTDFLVKHPYVRLTNNSLTNRHKGYGYNCLAELLKFLQTHSVLDVLGSNYSEFVELLQDMRLFAFDKEWLDGVERRVLFHGLQVSQDQDVLQKLLHFKQQVTKEVEMLHFNIGFFTQQLEDRETILENITKQEEQVLEARAALNTPIGY